MDKYFNFYLQNCVIETVNSIGKKYNYNEMQALNEFLNSKTYKLLENKDAKMWEFGNPVIFEIWEIENETGDPQNSSYLRGGMI